MTSSLFYFSRKLLASSPVWNQEVTIVFFERIEYLVLGGTNFAFQLHGCSNQKNIQRTDYISFSPKTVLTDNSVMVAQIQTAFPFQFWRRPPHSTRHQTLFLKNNYVMVAQIKKSENRLHSPPTQPIQLVPNPFTIICIGWGLCLK